MEMCTCGSNTAGYPPVAQNGYYQQTDQSAYQRPTRRSQANAQNTAAGQPVQDNGYYGAAQPGTGYYRQPEPQQNTGTMQRTGDAPKYSFSGKLGDVVLSQGEVHVRSYMIGKYPFGSGECTLFVTNKRVILRKNYNWLIFRHYEISDLNIENVHGLRCGFGKQLNPFWFLASLVPFIFGIVSFSGRQSGLGLLLLVVALVLFIVSCLSTHSDLSIIGTDEHSPVNMEHSLGGLFGKLLPELGVLKCRPTKDLDVMAVELGACLYDLRTYGDTAIPRWKR